MKCLRPIVLTKDYSVPCRKCINCRRARVNDWAIRLEDESLYHKDIIFITLTYNNENLPSFPSISKRTATLFIKKLRKSIGSDIKIKYFLCGEYGEENLRPHYHAIIFGYKPNDLLLFKNEGFDVLYTSETLTKIWGYGFTTVALATPETIRYCLKYINKQSTSKSPHRNIEKPFSLMSTGLGLQFIKDNYKKIIKDKSIITKYGKTTIPRYYIKWIHENVDKNFLINEEYLTNKANINIERELKKYENYLRKHPNSSYSDYLKRARKRILTQEFLDENPVHK